MTTAPDAAHISTAQAAWRLVKSDPQAYAIAWIQWVGFHAAPLAIGWGVKVALDGLTGGATGVPWLILGAVLGMELARWTLLVSAAVQWHGAWVGWQTVPRVNILRSLTTGGGPVAGRLPSSPGEAVSRFRDDVQDVAVVLDVWLDISGSAISAAIALAVMASIEPGAALAVGIPVAVALTSSLMFSPRLRRWRRDSREATGAVTGFIGDTFGAILAVKTAGAEEATDARFRDLNEKRAVVALRDHVGSEVVRSLGYGTAEVTVGLVLLAVAGSVRSGQVSIGDVALFASYVGVIAGLAKWAGRVLVYHLQADVSVDRLAELTREGSRPAVGAKTTTHLRHGPPALESPSAQGPGITELAVRGLTVAHQTSGRGISDVNLTVRRGELVVVTGRVGAGKSTLLRGVLGLVEPAAGTVAIDGRVVDPATELIPPLVSYLPQVPRLFSEPLADTILLGHPDAGLDQAVWLACLEDDVAVMEDGVRTLVGPRGLRLSGGQIQRTGAARAFVREPALLVVDDLSSALDVETELRLWDRLRPAGSDGSTLQTALIVSHRPTILERANRVVVLSEGRVVDVVENP